MSNPQPVRVHVITGGFPVGSPAGHDMDYARLRLLQLLHERPNVTASVSGDFTDIDKPRTDSSDSGSKTAGGG